MLRTLLPPREHVKKMYEIPFRVPSFLRLWIESKSPVGESIVVLTVTIARPEEFVHVPRGTDLPAVYLKTTAAGEGTINRSAISLYLSGS